MSNPIDQEAELKDARRNSVIKSYESAIAANALSFKEGSVKASKQYIYQNQMDDAAAIVNMFYEEGRRIISVNKKTKVGADGLMIEIAKLLTTHHDNNFVYNPANVRIITGMSNISWQRDMIDKAPSCFKDKIFHHGKLSKADLNDLNNSVIMIDEIDSGDKEGQLLPRALKDSGVMDVNYMEENNIIFVIISASLIRELYQVYEWGELHGHFEMTIPPSYIGHYDFLQMGIIQEFYPLTSKETVEEWIRVDILQRFSSPCVCKYCNPSGDAKKVDFRVHIVRVTAKSVDIIQNACIKMGIKFKNHTSLDRLTPEDEDELFHQPLTHHVVVAVKGLWRRANLIPDKWKLRIGSTHELYTKKVDNSVQNQALPGRMTGHWRHIIEAGHKTGIYRTSMKAIQEIEDVHKNPFGENTYQAAGFTKNKKGAVKLTPTMLSAKNISNLTPSIRAVPRRRGSMPIRICPITEEEKNLLTQSKKRGKHAITLDILTKSYPDDAVLYNSYKIGHWTVTSDNFNQWAIANMLKSNAYSSETNIRNKTKNEMIIYLYENSLIFQAWNGLATIPTISPP